MNKLTCFTAMIFVFGIALVLPPDISAKGKGTPKKPAPVVHDTVSLVSETSITVMGKKDTKTYSISRFTEIIVNGQSATAKAIEVGMLVSVGADSNGTATLINAQTPHEPAKAPGKK